MNTRINWQAIDKAQREFKENFRKEHPTEMYKRSMAISMAEMWQAWILENGGLKHEALSIEVVDEQQYMLFLLRWS